jgi:hypothetical protein
MHDPAAQRSGTKWFDDRGEDQSRRTETGRCAAPEIIGVIVNETEPDDSVRDAAPKLINLFNLLAAHDGDAAHNILKRFLSAKSYQGAALPPAL